MPYKDPQKRREAVTRSRLKHIERRRKEDRDLKKKRRVEDGDAVRAADKIKYHRTLKFNQTRMKNASRNSTRWWRREKYGVTAEQFEILFEAQNGKCKICDRPSVKALVVDHCHITGRVRGLLCRKCNSGIGMLCDDPVLVASALRYLRGNDQV